MISTPHGEYENDGRAVQPPKRTRVTLANLHELGLTTPDGMDAADYVNSLRAPDGDEDDEENRE